MQALVDFGNQSGGDIVPVNVGSFRPYLVTRPAHVQHILRRQISVPMDRRRELLRPLESSCPQVTGYLTRQLGFAGGFYQVTDFWGSL
jgi:hypothetical protein